jgi:hypothetical protein
MDDGGKCKKENATGESQGAVWDCPGKAGVDGSMHRFCCSHMRALLRLLFPSTASRFDGQGRLGKSKTIPWQWQGRKNGQGFGSLQSSPFSCHTAWLDEVTVKECLAA